MNGKIPYSNGIKVSYLKLNFLITEEIQLIYVKLKHIETRQLTDLQNIKMS